jgi:hypothetical protein
MAHTDTMEKLVAELRTVMPFKKTTATGDVVLIAAEDPHMLLYAMVTDIVRDANKRDEWWNISLTLLTVPLQKAVWTLRTEQMTGREIFTMGGKERFFQALDLSEGSSPGEQPPDDSSPPPSKALLRRVK